MQLRGLLSGAIVGLSLVAVSCQQQNSPTIQSVPVAVAQGNPERTLDVPYVPTPEPVVKRMLELAKVNSNDVVYDLGSGDGRIPIAAVREFNAKRAVGIDIDPDRVREANENARRAKVSDRVEFRQQDLFETDLRSATVVTLYLLPDINLRLRPRLLNQLKPGTRIVSHAFGMGDWKPDRVEALEGRTVYFWTVPKDIPANLRQ